MSKLQIIIADTDEIYLEKLESKLVKELGKRVSYEVISDRAYFKSYFQTAKTAEILVVSESLFTSDLLKHNINNVFVLVEQDSHGSTENLGIQKINKYTAIKEIYNELIYRSRDRIFAGDMAGKESTVIALYSAVGGCGKTAIGLGLASCLVENHKRVLYINTESIPSFSFYFADQTRLSHEACHAIRENQGNMYMALKPHIRRAGFAYLPAFSATLDALNLQEDLYVKLIKDAKESKEFDYIIVDVEAGYHPNRIHLLQEADKSIMVLLQSREAIYKTEFLLQNVDMHDKDKYIFVCNMYRGGVDNAYMNSKMQKIISMTEYIEYVPEDLEDLRQLGQLKGVQKLAYMFV